MIKIMHFCSDSNIGGAGVTLARLLSKSDKNRFEHYVVLPRGAALKEKLALLDVKVICYDTKADSSFELLSVLEFVRIISRVSPHIVHTHGLFSARVAAYICGVKSRIYTRHTYADVKTSKAIGVLNSVITTKAIAVNRQLIEQIEHSGINKKNILLIENGCECMKQDRAFDCDSFTILYHGRIEKSKGLTLALKAVSYLLGQSYKVQLLIVGDGEYKQELLLLSKKLKLGEHVKFFSYTNDVKKYINMSDCIINCSYKAEGTSNSVIEGMSASIVPVLSSVGGNLSVVNDTVNGLLFKSGSAISLSECIARLISDKELYGKLADMAYKTYLSRFTASVMAYKYEKLWKDEYEKYYQK